MTKTISLVFLIGLNLVRAEDPGVLYTRALGLFEARHLDKENAVKAKEIAGQILDKEPENINALIIISRYYLFFGQAQKTNDEKIKQYDTGAVLAKKAIKLNEKSADAHFYYAANLGRNAELKGIFNALGIAGEVKKEMEKTLECDKDHALAKTALANYYYRVPGFFGGNTEKAIKLLKETIESHPNLTMAFVELARIYKDQGKKKEASALLEQVMENKNPENEAYYFLYDKNDAGKLLKELKQ